MSTFVCDITWNLESDSAFIDWLAFVYILNIMNHYPSLSSKIWESGLLEVFYEKHFLNIDENPKS